MQTVSKRRSTVQVCWPVGLTSVSTVFQLKLNFRQSFEILKNLQFIVNKSHESIAFNISYSKSIAVQKQLKAHECATMLRDRFLHYREHENSILSRSHKYLVGALNSH